MGSGSRTPRRPKRLELRRRAFKRVPAGTAGPRPLTTTAEISRRMGNVRQQGTQAELSVRRVARVLGLRYTTENRDLPGSPDLANRTRRFAVFVHGCFWHRHAGCTRATTPKTNRRFWIAKFNRNRQRDLEVQRRLEHDCFRTVVIWECEAEKDAVVARRLAPLATPDIGVC